MEERNSVRCLASQLVPFCLLPPALGLAFTLVAPGGPLPFTSVGPPPSSPSIFTVLRRRLLLTFGLVLALVPWLPLVLVPCWLCCATIATGPAKLFWAGLGV